MKNQRIRLTAITGATMALVIAGTAAVSAHPGDDQRQRGFDRDNGRASIGARQGAKAMAGMRDGMRGGIRDGMRDGIRAAIEDFERRETTVQTADGITTRRVEQGVIDSASEASLGFSLGSGEAVTVTIDDDTKIIALNEETVERGRWSRQRMVPTDVDVAGIEAGANVVVWSDSEGDGGFVAERILIRPAADEDVDEMTADEAETEAETLEETTTEEAASTDA